MLTFSIHAFSIFPFKLTKCCDKEHITFWPSMSAHRMTLIWRITGTRCPAGGYCGNDGIRSPHRWRYQIYRIFNPDWRMWVAYASWNRWRARITANTSGHRSTGTRLFNSLISMRSRTSDTNTVWNLVYLYWSILNPVSICKEYDAK